MDTKKMVLMSCEVVMLAFVKRGDLRGKEQKASANTVVVSRNRTHNYAQIMPRHDASGCYC